MYFSGFCLQDEQCLFDSFFKDSDYTVAGFSYGAQKALEYALCCTTRIDKLILFSPAFFQSSSPSFIRTQERYFGTHKEQYIEQFYANVTYPANVNIIKLFKLQGNANELKELLTYRWDEEKLQILINKGIEIEVFIGGMDKIVDAKQSSDFFSKICTVYLIKNAGHLLQS